MRYHIQPVRTTPAGSALLLVLLFSTALLPAQQPLPETHYEKSGYRETPRYDKTVRYCQQLEQASNWILYTRFGLSAQGRDLPLLIIDKNGNFDPASVHRSRNAVVLIQAGIHAGEPDGKDAGFLLVRDMAVTKKLEHLLDNVTVLFIPIFNVDGHERFGPYNRINQNGPAEMGWRTNAANLNLNRDYLKAEAPEMKSWLALFNEWLPEFFIDCHVTDGADYQYAVTYSTETAGNMNAALTDWQQQSFIKPLENKMMESGFPIIPYVVFRKWHDPRSGLMTFASPPALSHGYTALQNRPSLLVETHMLKDYRTRVDATYQILLHSVEIVNRDYRRLIDLVREADEESAGPVRRNPFPVDFRLNERDSVMIDFLGVDYSAEPSDISGGTWFKYGKTPRSFRIPYYHKVVPSETVMLPEAYIIPAEWKEVLAKLTVHGIRYTNLPKETRVRVSSYRFSGVKFRETPFEGRHTVSFRCDTFTEERVFARGSALVGMNQRAARLIAYMLEPMAASSLAYWGYFSAVFEQKEYAESYVMEAMAREMMGKDPLLLKALQQKKEQDSKFAGSPQQILNWFYQQTPFWDDRKDVYPVGKIFDPAVVDRLKN